MTAYLTLQRGQGIPEFTPDVAQAQVVTPPSLRTQRKSYFYFSYVNGRKLRQINVNYQVLTAYTSKWLDFCAWTRRLGIFHQYSKRDQGYYQKLYEYAAVMLS